MDRHFQGIMVPVLTPFDEKREIAIEEFKKHLCFLIENQVDSLLIPSGTGEFANLTFEQKRQLLRAAVEVVDKRVPVVALISDCSTENVLSLLKMAEEEGADEVMLTPPYYSRIDQRAIIAFYERVADEAKVPVWIYQQPGETKLSLDFETVQILAKHPNICGIKVAGGDDFFYFTALVNEMKEREDFSILNGEDYCTLPSYTVGGDGSVSSIANVIPAELVKIWRAHQEGNYEEALKRQDYIMECCTFLEMVETGAYQSACKTALREMGHYSTNYVSSPFLEVLPEEERIIVERTKNLIM